MALKKLLCTVITAALIASSAVPALADVWGTVTSDNVNLRTEASTNSGIAKVLGKDTSILAKERAGDWYMLSTANYGAAYIHSDYFKIVQADAAVTGDSVNVRSSAEISENVIGKVNVDDKVVVIGQVGDWYKIVYNGGTAFVTKEFVKGELLEYMQETGTEGTAVGDYTLFETAPDPFAGCENALVCAETGLNLRVAPYANSGIVKLIPNGSTVYVVNVEESGWAHVKCVSGAEGYVASQYLKIGEGVEASSVVTEVPEVKEEAPEVKEEAPSYKAEETAFDFANEEALDSGSLAASIIDYAKRFIGTPYVWGGTDLKNGVDCSGFIYSVLRHFEIYVDRTSRQMSENGYFIPKDELRPGDLVFFDSDGVNDGKVSHVGMYIGDGKYIHSSSGKAYGVTITGLAEDYSSRTYVTARRVFD